MTQKTLYLDMDGVVADWITGSGNILGYRLTHPNDMYPAEDWAKLKFHKHLFWELPKVDLSDDLVALARRFRDELDYELLFLTAIPHNNDMPWAFHDKIKWAEQYWPDIPVHFGPYSREKNHHCKPGDILVDDREDNCQAWTQAGGRSILVNPSTDLREALVILENIFNQELGIK